MSALNDQILEIAAGKYISYNSDCVEEYEKLRKANQDGHGDGISSDYAEMWEDYEFETVKKILELIELEIKTLTDFAGFVRGLPETHSPVRRVIQLRGPGDPELALISVLATVTDEEIQRAHREFTGSDSEESFEEFCHSQYADWALERLFVDEVQLGSDQI